MRFSIPIYLPSLANLRLSWRRMARLKKAQRLEVWVAMRGRAIPQPPLIVTITRVGPRALDDDNLASACKYVRDQIAEGVGVDDGSPLYKWRYRQRADKRYSVEIDIAPIGNGSEG